jgi:hypothetical protein
MNIDTLQPETFSPLVGTLFRVALDGMAPIELKLAEVSVTARAGQAAGQEIFSLIFLGPEKFYLPQKIYAFEHAELGRFELFIVPIGRRADAIEYQAVFNRLRAKAG